MTFNEHEIFEIKKSLTEVTAQIKKLNSEKFSII